MAYLTLPPSILLGLKDKEEHTYNTPVDKYYSTLSIKGLRCYPKFKYRRPFLGIVRAKCLQGY